MDLDHLIQKWLIWDKDPTTNLEIRQLQDNNNVQELQNRLGSRIRFGTAGLRGRMQAGFAFMNGLTVIQASQGLARYLVQTNHDSQPVELIVVIGHDTRHNSAKFAKFAANAFSYAGITVQTFSDYVPTPLVAFRVRHFHAAAGIMITASHNPAQDNGFKVYGSNGAQIQDDVAAAIAESISLNEEPWPNAWDVDPLGASEGLREATQKSYIHRLSAVQKQQMPDALEGAPSHPKVVYTPMHGVGWLLMDRVARDVHNMHLIPCESQQLPDPDFPTVAFPNPEETGALQLAMEKANQENAHVILATDPDADRFAAACRMPDGKWHQFTGDQMGVLFADFLMQQELQKNSAGHVFLICTAVSSAMMGRIVDHNRGRFSFEQTLTGFKWIGNKAYQLLRQGRDPVFGYEEALGYMFPAVSYDKDGIAAASLFLFAQRQWSLQGMTPYEKLLDLYRTYGWFDSINTYFVASTPIVTKEFFDSIRRSDELKSLKLGHFFITRWRDVTNGLSFGEWRFQFTDPGSQMLSFDVSDSELEGNVLFTLRASGTEPKMKIYLESSAPDRGTAQRLSKKVFDSLVIEWIRRFGGQLSHNGHVVSSLGQRFAIPE
ncbi:MAG: hypothetical protein Q9227_001301 [Pyrenula ochraceoflavens]